MDMNSISYSSTKLCDNTSSVDLLLYPDLELALSEFKQWRSFGYA